MDPDYVVIASVDVDGVRVELVVEREKVDSVRDGSVLFTDAVVRLALAT